jgi:hypothetical protein
VMGSNGAMTARRAVTCWRLPKELLLALVVAGFILGATVSVAFANHWHSGASCGAWNGLVHGSSSSDGYVRARVERNVCGAWYHRCAVYNHMRRGYLVTASAITGDCNAPTDGNGYRESCSEGDVEYTNVFGRHGHLAHNWYCP